MLRVVLRLQVEAAWAAAAFVFLSGAAGPYAANVNGLFEQVDREVYRKVGEPGRWLFVDMLDQWVVSNTADKDVRKTSSMGWAHLVALAGGMPPPAGAGRWQVDDGSKWVEQTMQIHLL